MQASISASLGKTRDVASTVPFFLLIAFLAVLMTLDLREEWVQVNFFLWVKPCFFSVGPSTFFIEDKGRLISLIVWPFLIVIGMPVLAHCFSFLVSGGVIP